MPLPEPCFPLVAVCTLASRPSSFPHPVHPPSPQLSLVIRYDFRQFARSFGVEVGNYRSMQKRRLHIWTRSTTTERFTYVLLNNVKNQLNVRIKNHLSPYRTESLSLLESTDQILMVVPLGPRNF